MRSATRIIIVFLALIFLTTPVTVRAAQDPATGFWLTENTRSVIEIKPCEQGLCGYVYWITENGMKYDSENPDPARRTEPMCGLPILWGFEHEGAGTWTDGKIYKADDGDMYSAELQVRADGTLKVHGYMGLSWFGKTQIWTPVKTKDYKACTTPK